MVCPFCGRIKTSVRNSRGSGRRGQVWRRRHCERCGRHFTTRESVELGFLEVLKRSGRVEGYSRDKLLRSLIYATDHLDNANTAIALADTIETNLLHALPQAAGQITSHAIAEAVLDVLKRFDPPAYVKYLSYQTKHLGAAELRRKLVKS